MGSQPGPVSRRRPPSRPAGILRSGPTNPDELFIVSKWNGNCRFWSGVIQPWGYARLEVPETGQSQRPASAAPIPRRERQRPDSHDRAARRACKWVGGRLPPASGSSTRRHHSSAFDRSLCGPRRRVAGGCGACGLCAPFAEKRHQGFHRHPRRTTGARSPGHCGHHGGVGTSRARGCRPEPTDDRRFARHHPREDYLHAIARLHRRRRVCSVCFSTPVSRRVSRSHIRWHCGKRIITARQSPWRQTTSLRRRLPLYHDMGLLACTVMPFVHGIPLVTMSAFDWVRRPAALLQAITTWQATLCLVAQTSRIITRAGDDRRRLGRHRSPIAGTSLISPRAGST